MVTLEPVCNDLGKIDGHRLVAPFQLYREDKLRAQQIEAGRFLVGLSAHLGFCLLLGKDTNMSVFREGHMVGTFIQLDKNIWPVGPFGGKGR